VLALADATDLPSLKCIRSVLDRENVLNEAQVKLALFMRERFFCTVYDAVRAMLPAGLWFDEQGRQKANDKTVEIASLAISGDEAEALVDAKRLRSPQQSALLELLCCFGALPVRDMLVHTGAKRPSLAALEKSGAVVLSQREVYRRPEIKSSGTLPLPVLNEAQSRAYAGLRELAFSGKANAALLFGVTGSGKTSVYIRLIDEVLKNGKSAVLLVPEIALTPQMLSTFSAHFGEEVAVLHSSLSVGERYDEWKRIHRGEARLVIGTRSAVFAPVKKLGVLIIDEEQEETYKSENSPRYDAREVAKYLCARADSLLLMGSATPRIESMYQARGGKYHYFELTERYNKKDLPSVTIVDMKRELRRGNGGDISSFLREELQKNIERGEQSILFINRRGASKLVSCGECGFTYRCPKCSVSLTYHSASRRLMCHYCGYSRRVDGDCPECGGELKYVGSGTQHVEQELREFFPETGILRMDTDTVTPVGSHEKLLDRFRDENIPIMVGTQMVTKGLNFEKVTLVGVICADQSLYSGDYRAGERTFSLITQVVGRSGRGEKTGRAVIQTYTPDNQTIRQAAVQDYDDFYASEIKLRALQNAPPIVERYTVTVSGQNEEQVEWAIRYLFDLMSLSAKEIPGTDVLGPAPLSVVKVNDRFRYRVNITGKNGAAMRKAISAAIIACSADKRFRGVNVFADHDPTD
ncbi:MAG: primosomal protein N', partial [Oscillospiraceae bacterium]|nr:primosomal protein N' [Oscillospiraceae bacterium]